MQIPHGDGSTVNLIVIEFLASWVDRCVFSTTLCIIRYRVWSQGFNYKLIGGLGYWMYSGGNWMLKFYAWGELLSLISETSIRVQCSPMLFDYLATKPTVV